MEPLNHETTSSILKEIVSNTTSDLILFSIVILIGLCIVMIPVFMVSQRNAKDLRKNNSEEKAMLINIVDNNTKAITNLSLMLENNSMTTLDTLKQIHKSIGHNTNMLQTINDRQIEIHDKLEHTSDMVDIVRNKL